MKKDLNHWLVKVSLLAGMILVVFLIIIGIVKLIPTTISSLASVGTSLSSTLLKPSEKIEVATNKKSLNTNEEFTLSWSHTSKDTSGFYTFSYECKDNVTIDLNINNKKEKIYCNTPTNLSVSENVINLVPTLSKASSYTDVVLTISYVEDGQGSAKISGNSSITVKNGSIGTSATNTQTTTQSTTTNRAPVITYPTYNYNTVYQTSNPYGVPNLRTRILRIGAVDRMTGQYISGRILANYDNRVAVTFEISNTGNRETGPWIFNATLPTEPIQTFTSFTQNSLMPGESKQFTLAFDGIKIDGSDKFVVTADPFNTVYESNMDDNSASSLILTY